MQHGSYIQVRFGYLLKQGITWNDLKQPTTSKKQSERTYNNRKRPTTNKKQPTESNKRPEMIHNEQDTISNDMNLPTMRKKKSETTSNKQILRLFYNMGQSVFFTNTFSI